MIGGIILTHGPIASALIQAGETILGEIDDVNHLSTKGLSLDGISEKLKKIISAGQWSDGIIIMVSLKGGSCWNAAVVTARQIPDIEVVRWHTTDNNDSYHMFWGT